MTRLSLHAKDLRGFRNGRLVVIKPVEQRSTQGGILWRCKCDCGGEKIVPGVNLRKGDRGTRSCGCLTREANARRAKVSEPWNKGLSYQIGGSGRIYTQKQNWAKAVIRERGNRCEICGWAEARCDVHHRVPVSKGGLNTVGNGIVLCPNHHRIEHERTAECG